MKQLTIEKIENRAKDIIAARSKIYLLEYISKSKKSVLQECLEFGIPRSTFYEWKKKYELESKDGLVRKKPMANNHPNKIRQPVIDKVIDLRENCIFLRFRTVSPVENGQSVPFYSDTCS